MYYEEKVINGILYHRNTPNGEFIPYSLPEIIALYLSEKIEKEAFVNLYNDLREDLCEVLIKTILLK